MTNQIPPKKQKLNKDGDTYFHNMRVKPHEETYLTEDLCEESQIDLENEVIADLGLNR